jgi:hypothetical protein
MIGVARRKSLNTFENQSTLSLVLGIVGLLAAAAALGLLARNADAQFFETYWIVYGEGSSFLPILGGVLAVAVAAGVSGFLLGLNAADQRRNARSKRAWLGFFLNAAAMTLAVCAGVAFVLMRHKIQR